LERNESDPYKCTVAFCNLGTHLVVSQSVITNSTAVARKLCPCTRQCQDHGLGSVGALPNGSLTLPNEPKVPSECLTTSKIAKLKADCWSPTSNAFPTERASVKADGGGRVSGATIGRQPARSERADTGCDRPVELGLSRADPEVSGQGLAVASAHLGSV